MWHYVTQLIKVDKGGVVISLLQTVVALSVCVCGGGGGGKSLNTVKER